MFKSVGTLIKIEKGLEAQAVWVRKFPGVGYSCGLIANSGKAFFPVGKAPFQFTTVSVVLPIGKYHLRTFELPALPISEAERICAASFLNQLGSRQFPEISVSMSKQANRRRGFASNRETGLSASSNPGDLWLSAYPTSNDESNKNSSGQPLTAIPSALAVERSLPAIFGQGNTNDGIIILQAEGGFLAYLRREGQTHYCRAIPTPGHALEILFRTAMSMISKYRRLFEGDDTGIPGIGFHGSDESFRDLQSRIAAIEPGTSIRRLEPVDPFSTLHENRSLPLDQISAALWGLPSLSREWKSPLRNVGGERETHGLYSKIAVSGILALGLYLGTLRIEVSRNLTIAEREGRKTKEVFSQVLKDRRMVDPVFQMEREVSLRKNNAATTESLLPSLVGLLSGIPAGCVVFSVEIDEKDARLTGTAKDFTTLGRLRSHLSNFSDFSPDLSVNRDGTGNINFRATLPLSDADRKLTRKES